MLKFMQTPISLVILNMRSKYPMEQAVNEKGKKEWVRCKDLEPKQSEDILYEMFVHGWIEKENHHFHRTKCTSRTLEGVFVNGQPLSLDTGRKLAAWAKGAATAPPADEATITAGKAAADKGAVAYVAWRDSLPALQRESIRPYNSEWSKAAKESDAAEAEAKAGGA